MDVRRFAQQSAFTGRRNSGGPPGKPTPIPGASYPAVPAACRGHLVTSRIPEGVMGDKHVVRFEPVGIEIEVGEEQTILRAAFE